MWLRTKKARHGLCENENDALYLTMTGLVVDDVKPLRHQGSGENRCFGRHIEEVVFCVLGPHGTW